MSKDSKNATEEGTQPEPRRSSIVQLKASGEISIEVMQVTDNHFETSTDITRDTPHPALRQQSSISKCSTTTSPDHNDTKDHFKKQYNWLEVAIAVLFMKHPMSPNNITMS